MNDKDIRQFILDNKIKVHNSEKFMREIKRQIELLPSQSALNENEKKALWVTIFETEAKYNRRNAVFTALVNLITLSVSCFAILYLLPLAGGTSIAIDFAITYRYLILIALCLLTSADTMLNFSKKI